jgi:hypothetical protein
MACLLVSAPAIAQKFYPDDPLTKEPPPVATVSPEVRALSTVLEYFGNTFGKPGERQPLPRVIEAGGVNTLGEVMDGPWYTNRHWTHRMTSEELRRGPGAENPPSADGRWLVLSVKKYDVRPGMLIADSRRTLYLLRFDPRDNLEMATGAEVVAGRFFHALGYHVPESYIVYFTRDKLEVSELGTRTTSAGTEGTLEDLDVDVFLRDVARDPTRGYRAVATRIDPAWDGLLGPYQVYGTRSDDPNDIVPHEHRRDLRGLFVFSAWLNHFQMRAVNTMDVLTHEGGIPHIRHLLVDFVGTLGGGWGGPKAARDGNEPLFDFDLALKHAAGFGFDTPGWMRARYPGLPSVGNFESATFDPERWTPNHQIAPFANRLPDDEFWAAKQVMAFTDDDIRTIVATGQYTDPAAVDYLTKTLAERRDRTGRTYFAKVLPLDRFRLEDGRLIFDDLAVVHGFTGARPYSVRWLEVNNRSGVLTQLGLEGSFDLPEQLRTASPGAYYAARIWRDDPETTVTVYFRTTGGGGDIVGVERGWPGKEVATEATDVGTGVSGFGDLVREQQRLFEPYARSYNAETGRSLAPQEYFDSLTISERTTYEAVTHALLHSELTDAQGKSLGKAFDRIDSLERIAGQYYGRSGDQQFRLYVRLKPDTVEILEKSQQFRRDHENTVYHPGFPHSFRQNGKEPTLQFSISEDGSQADVDVDYRSSKSPQALFNGHLTSANSDVRAGDNVDRHNTRWTGLIAWWQGFFGRLATGNVGPTDSLSTSIEEVPTPLPPDRPRGTHIEAIQDAAQEFLTDWLVRRHYDDAMEFATPSVYACLNVSDRGSEDALSGRRAQGALREIMRYSAEQLGERTSLTAAIDAVKPWDPNRVVVSQPFEGDFTVIKMTPGESQEYLCGQQPAEVVGGEYYGVLFQFKKAGAAALGLLWRREQGEWRIVAYRAFEQ